jgi:hypothetical protein
MEAVCVSETGIYLFLQHHIKKSAVWFFFVMKGPAAESYGRTAALRLIVQPYDEDEDDDDYFLSFS